MVAGAVAGQAAKAAAGKTASGASKAAGKAAGDAAGKGGKFGIQTPSQERHNSAAKYLNSNENTNSEDENPENQMNYTGSGNRTTSNNSSSLISKFKNNGGSGKGKFDLKKLSKASPVLVASLVMIIIPIIILVSGVSLLGSLSENAGFSDIPVEALEVVGNVVISRMLENGSMPSTLAEEFTANGLEVGYLGTDGSFIAGLRPNSENSIALASSSESAQESTDHSLVIRFGDKLIDSTNWEYYATTDPEVYAAYSESTNFRGIAYYDDLATSYFSNVAGNSRNVFASYSSNDSGDFRDIITQYVSRSNSSNYTIIDKRCYDNGGNKVVSDACKQSTGENSISANSETSDEEKLKAIDLYLATIYNNTLVDCDAQDIDYWTEHNDEQLTDPHWQSINTEMEVCDNVQASIITYLVNSAVNANEAQESGTFFLTVQEAVSKTKAGEGSSAPINELFNYLTTPDEDGISAVQSPTLSSLLTKSFSSYDEKKSSLEKYSLDRIQNATNIIKNNDYIKAALTTTAMDITANSNGSTSMLKLLYKESVGNEPGQPTEPSEPSDPVDITKENLDDVKNYKATLDKTNDYLAALNDYSTRFYSKYSTEKSQYDSDLSSYESLKTSYITAKNDYNSAKSNYNTAQTNYNTAKSNYNSIQTELSQKKAALAAATDEATINLLNEEITKLELKSESAKNTRDSAYSEMQNKKHALDNAKTVYENIKSQYENSYTKACESYKTTYKTYKDTYVQYVDVYGRWWKKSVSDNKYEKNSDYPDIDNGVHETTKKLLAEIKEKLSAKETTFLSSDGFKSIIGSHAGETFAKGGSIIESGISSSTMGGTPGTEEVIAAYQKRINDTIALRAKAERLEKSPFDTTSQNTFLGSIINSFANYFYTTPSLSSSFTSFSTMLGQSISSILPEAFAENSTSFYTTYGNCPESSDDSTNKTFACNIYSEPITTFDLNKITTINIDSLSEPEKEYSDYINNRLVNTGYTSHEIAEQIWNNTELTGKLSGYLTQFGTFMENKILQWFNEENKIKDYFSTYYNRFSTEQLAIINGNAFVATGTNKDLAEYQAYIINDRILDGVNYYDTSNTNTTQYANAFTPGTGESTYLAKYFKENIKNLNNLSDSEYLAKITGFSENEANIVLGYFAYNSYLASINHESVLAFGKEKIFKVENSSQLELTTFISKINFEIKATDNLNKRKEVSYVA